MQFFLMIIEKQKQSLDKVLYDNKVKCYRADKAWHPLYSTTLQWCVSHNAMHGGGTTI